MKLIFEMGAPGRGCELVPECPSPYNLETTALRKNPLRLPEVSETEISRHYTDLAKQAYGVNDGFYPLGSCTMKYNPKVSEEAAALPGFTGIHPLQETMDVQGCLEILLRMEGMLCEITGMDACTLQPAAGAHGEFTGLLLIKAYHAKRGDMNRTKIIVPDSAHGTNPASAAMAGFDIVNIASDAHGCVDLEALRRAVGDDTAGLMLTNPNTVGIFDPNIAEITHIVHEAGGLCYYDGANLNAIMGIVRPGDMGFDVMHLNLHKTFAAPHGGGGPGSGPIACKEFLADFLPGMRIQCAPNAECFSTEGGSESGWRSLLSTPDRSTACQEIFESSRALRSIGDVRCFYGNFLVIVRSYCYILTLGREGIPEAATGAVLNANYMMHGLKNHYHVAYDRVCMHEFVVTLEQEKRERGVSALDIAKALLDHGVHPPTMYFPLIVHEALMIEPTETESRETLDEAIGIFLDVLKQSEEVPEKMSQYPMEAPIRRPDEVAAARKPEVRYQWD
ncbi:MAG: aminomethyl-transferring glycine dehydrogenase subunit GcvPB [Lachnospiraceae bacterium]|nr:aminomethyl-transferring glycine dehydrogenase subunit GcvPB [Lachnospiraceae bacterium]